MVTRARCGWHRNFDEMSEIQSKNYTDGTVVIKVKNQSRSTSNSPCSRTPARHRSQAHHYHCHRLFRQTESTFVLFLLTPCVWSSSIFPRGESQVHRDSDLRNGARNNLRMFEWEMFEPDLLQRDQRHPREGATIQSLHRIVVLKISSIRQDKSLALTMFAARFDAQHGRKPTFWLDKVCIDQRETSR